jgi:hypothetical protein
MDDHAQRRPCGVVGKDAIQPESINIFQWHRFTDDTGKWAPIKKTSFKELKCAYIQSFFAWRFLVFSHRRLIPCICWFLSLTRFTASILCLVEALDMKTLPQVLVQWRWLLTFVL